MLSDVKFEILMMGNEKHSSEQRIDRPCKKVKPIGAIGTQSGGETRDIPQDTIAEILVRLPVKSLLRFKCVAKSWFSLICSESFIKAHLEFSTRDPNFSDYRLTLGVSYNQFHGNVNHGSVSSLVCDLLNGEIDDADLPDNQNDWRFEVTGSCDGLLCVSVRHSFLSINHAFLWNPSLRMSKKLPRLPEAENGKVVSSTYGIVYDEPNDNYKVVGLFWGEWIGAGVLVEIYSLKNDSQKRITNSKCGIPTSGSSMVYANGKVHFLASFQRDDLSIGTDIVSLDLESDVFGTVEQQPIHGAYGHHISVGVLKGCISAVYSYTDGYAYVCVLKEYGVTESWTNLVRIPYVYLPSIHNNYRPYRLCTVSNGKYLLGCGSRLLVYDPRDNSFVCPRNGNVDKICSTGIYVESLVSLPGMES